MELKPIARIETDFGEKFGIPRQGRLISQLTGRIVFEPGYRSRDALKGLEDFSHLWLIWHFSQVPEGRWSPMVRPPRLGGNEKMGVFATRSPFRPNALGLTCVKIDGIDYETGEGPVIRVSGVDMVDQTPIFDIKPYIPYADSYPKALGGFTERTDDSRLNVRVSWELLQKIPENKREALHAVLALDPRPGYQNDPGREYGLDFAGMNVRFKVNGRDLEVFAIEKDGKGE